MSPTPTVHRVEAGTADGSRSGVEAAGCRDSKLTRLKKSEGSLLGRSFCCSGEAGLFVIF